MKINWCFCIFFLTSCIASAQYWTKQHFNVENGLPNNYTFAVEKFQDEIYVATDGGLVIFDGATFKIQHKKDIRYPVALLNVHDSVLYVGSWLDGIFHKKDESLQNIYPDRINRILKTKNKHLLYNTYQHSALIQILPNHKVDTIVDLLEPNPKRLIAIDGSSVYVKEEEAITEYSWQGIQKNNFTPTATTELQTLFAFNGKLFYSDLEGNLTWFPKQHPEKKYTNVFENTVAVKHITPYRKQQFLVQLYHGGEQNSLGLATFDASYETIVDFEIIVTINSGISDVFIDRETIYVASYGSGFYKLFPSMIKSYDKNEHQLAIPKFIYENEENEMVFATENVAYTLKENDSFVQQKYPHRLNDIFQYDGKRYFSSHANVYNNDFKRIAKTRMNSILYAAKNDTVFYSKYWLSRYHDGIREDIHCIHYKRDDKKLNTAILLDSTIYIGTQKGVKLFRKNAIDIWTEEKDSLLQNYFYQRVIRHIRAQGNRVILTTPYEAYAYDGHKIIPLQFTDQDIYINDVFVDDQSRIYFGTNKGFWMMTDNYTYHFNIKNGTNSDNIYSFYQDTKGIIWMISGNGIMELNPNQIDITQPPNIEIDQKNIQDDHVLIQFKSATRHFSEAVSFQYKINHSEWRNLPNQELEMSNLKPGDYVVSFRGKRINSEWSLPYVVQFTIVPKWYQMTAIKIIIFIAVILLTVGFLWYRLRVIKRRNETLSNEINRRIFLEHKVENLREEVARDFHDEIGNKIASVIGLSNNLKHSEQISSPKIDKIADLSKEVYHTAKDFVWSLNPKNNNIESLCKYLRDYGETFFDLFDEIDFLYLEIDIIPIEISYVKSRNIILAYKEILANILKHSNATKVIFKAYLENTLLVIQIQDNGVGITEQKSTHGNGLKNIQKRMEMIQAKMSVNTSEGVCYTFVIELQEELTKHETYE